MPETQTKILKDYLIIAGIKGKVFCNRAYGIYSVEGANYIGIKGTTIPKGESFILFWEDVIHDQEATPEEVQRAKEGQLVGKVEFSPKPSQNMVPSSPDGEFYEDIYH